MNLPISSFQADIIGFIGSFFIIAAFAYSNISKQMNLLIFNILNLLGAALLAISLTVNFNLPSMILQFIWVAIALFGIGRILCNKLNRKRGRTNPYDEGSYQKAYWEAYERPLCDPFTLFKSARTGLPYPEKGRNRGKDSDPTIEKYLSDLKGNAAVDLVFDTLSYLDDKAESLLTINSIVVAALAVIITGQDPSKQSADYFALIFSAIAFVPLSISIWLLLGVIKARWPSMNDIKPIANKYLGGKKGAYNSAQDRVPADFLAACVRRTIRYRRARIYTQISFFFIGLAIFSALLVRIY